MLQKIIKNSTSFNHLKTEFNAGKLSHALMFVCSDNTYLQSYVKEFAKLLFCENLQDGSSCGNCVMCNNAEKLISADIMVYGREENITTEDAEKIISDAYVRPYSADKKLYILFNYDNVNDTVENKLLKTIEEPPKDVIFLLLVSNTNKLLQTTLSRTQKIYLGGLTISELTEILKSKNVPDAEIIAVQTGGNLEKAESYTKGNSARKITEFVLDCLLNMQTTSRILEYASIFAGFEGELEDVVNCFANVVLDVIKAKSGAQTIIANKMYASNLNQIASSFSYTALTKIIEATYLAKQMKEANVASTNIIDQFLLKIVEVKLKCKK